MRRQRALVATLLLGVVPACGSPTEPDDYNGRSGLITLIVTCSGQGDAELACGARTVCTGLYCTPAQRASDQDVTASATWGVAAPTVRHVGGGRFAASGIGASAITASIPGQTLHSEPLAVEVFPGRQPQQVYRLWGRVGHGEMVTGPLGTLPRIDQPVDGVTVEVVTGPAAGRQGVTGRRSPAPPGLVSFVGPGEFEIMGVPNQAVTIEVRPSGRAPIRQDLAGPFFLLPILVPR